MKKRMTFITALCIGISFLSACSTNTSVVTETTHEAASEPTEVIESTGNEDSTPQTPAADVSQDNLSCFDVTISETSNDYMTSDGSTILFTDSYQTPTLVSEKYPDAADKITAAWALLFSNHNDYVDEMVKYAQNDYDLTNSTEFSAESSNYPFTPYSGSSVITVTRNDDHIISFLENDSYYEGGAHGQSVSASYTYNSATGNLISFDALADNMETFQADILTYVQTLCETDAYKDLLFDNYSTYLSEALFTDSTWYFDRSGLVFVCDPYELGSYSAGALTFSVPYSNLADYGLKEAYAYTGALIISVPIGNTIAYDLNGDGTAEEILYSTSYSDSSSTTLLIDSVEYSSVLTNSMDLKYSWQSDYCLVDMDSSDSTEELAFFESSYDENNNMLTTSYIFRYEKNGSLSFVEKIEGDLRYNGVSL